MLLVCGVYVGLTIAIFVPMIVTYVLFEESEWFWIFDAMASNIFGSVVIFVQVYLYCWYRQLKNQQQQVG